MWFDPALPEKKIFLNELNVNNINKKSILLLGNGESLKELYFLKFGEKIIYSDISVKSVSSVKNKFIFGKYEDKIAFHAIDAYSIPLSDESVDIIVGYAFVHHLNNLDSFFREVYRVLKPGGKCLFFDGAYSSVWQNLKFSILRPIVYFSHKRWGISPEDLRATHRGGYHKEEIENLKIKYNFSDMIFIRFGFLSYIFYRGMEKIVGHHQKIENVNKRIVPILFDIDNYFSKRSNIYYNSTMRLVWGFRKHAR
jgi:SAM-dependent methyltransferase